MRILNESRRDDMLLPYVNLLREKGINTNVSQLKQFLLTKFVNEGLIRNLSLSSNFYLAGVARYYFNGDLTTNKVLNVFDDSQVDEFNREICDRLNACILILRNAHIDSVGTEFEQPEDFGTLKISALLRKYNKKINDVLGIVTPKKDTKADETEKIDVNPNIGNGYTFDIIYSYDDARKYNKFTEPGAWCITYSEQHYNSYKKNLKIHYVILKQDGFENVPRKMGANFTKKKPQDEYGNSLIALLQSNENGEPVFITSRWNHGTSSSNNSGTEADHAYTKEELFAVTGMNDNDLQRIFKIWQQEIDIKKQNKTDASSIKRKETTEMLRYVKYGQMRMNGGENITKVFPGIRGKLLFGNPDNYKKSILGLAIPMEMGETVKWCTVLCDKGKIQFESFKFTEGDVYLNRVFTSSTIKSEWNDRTENDYNNLIEIKYDKYYTMFYDIKRHAFLDIGGVIKFKHVPWSGPPSWLKDKCVFIEVAMSKNQRAFFDFKTNKPLRLPNGEFWFESCETASGSRRHYDNDVKLKDVYTTDKCIYFTYDSASGEKYFYDINTRRFFNIDIEREGDFDISISTWEIPNEMYEFIVHEKGNWSNCFYCLYKNGKPAEINGDTVYKYTSFCNDLGLLTNLKGETNFVDLLTNTTITPTDKETGEVINVKRIDSICSYVKAVEEYKNFVWISTDGLYYTNKLLYDYKNNVFYLNPVTKGFIFYQYSGGFGSNGRGSLKVYNAPNHVGCRVIKGEDSRIVEISLEDVIEYTKNNYATAGSIPKTEKEDVIRWMKEFPELVSPDLIRQLEYEKYQEENGEQEHKMAESKLNVNDIMYIINETIKRIK